MISVGKRAIFRDEVRGLRANRFVDNKTSRVAQYTVICWLWAIYPWMRNTMKVFLTAAVTLSTAKHSSLAIGNRGEREGCTSGRQLHCSPGRQSRFRSGATWPDHRGGEGGAPPDRQ